MNCKEDTGELLYSDYCEYCERDLSIFKPELLYCCAWAHAEDCFEEPLEKLNELELDIIQTEHIIGNKHTHTMLTELIEKFDSENEFFNSLMAQLEKNFILSAKQKDCVEKNYIKYINPKYKHKTYKTVKTMFVEDNFIKYRTIGLDWS